jgi:hypothetical protein
MKTDIFKDLVPLLKMDTQELSELAKDIVRENQDTMNKIAIQFLFDKINQLGIKVLNEYKNENI